MQKNTAYENNVPPTPVGESHPVHTLIINGIMTSWLWKSVI